MFLVIIIFGSIFDGIFLYDQVHSREAQDWGGCSLSSCGLYVLAANKRANSCSGYRVKSHLNLKWFSDACEAFFFPQLLPVSKTKLWPLPINQCFQHVKIKTKLICFYYFKFTRRLKDCECQDHQDRLRLNEMCVPWVFHLSEKTPKNQIYIQYVCIL